MRKYSKIKIKRNGKDIHYSDAVFSAGSCFSENIKSYLEKKGMVVYSNPFGVLYNPHSILNMFKNIFDKKQYTSKDLISYSENYSSPDHSSVFSNKNIDEVLKGVNQTVDEASYIVKRSNVFVITLGTAVVYEYNGVIFANCHRIPQSHFTKRVLSIDEIVLNLIHIVSLIRANVDNPLIIFTVSPVRHYPDDLRLNTISKSLLHIAIDKVCKSEGCEYFPSYEIMIDELRDYSYYKNDLLHPGKTAVSYIMNKFVKSYCSSETINYMKKVIVVNKMMRHRSVNPYSDENYSLLKRIWGSIAELNRKNSTVYFDDLRYELISRFIIYFGCHPDIESYLKSILSEAEFKELLLIMNFLKSESTSIAALYGLRFMENQRIKQFILEKDYERKKM